MPRAFSSTWTRTAVLLVGLFGFFHTSEAWAAKPTIAILGLEVNDPNGTVDEATTSTARDLTEGLRGRAKVGAGPYQLAAGSDKELIDEKLLKSCDGEALACMTQIGKDLGADFMMYGKLEKKADGYQVTLNVLNIGKKKFEKSKAVKIPLGRDAKSLSDDARRLYNDLTGTVDAGTLVVTTNVQNGTVYLDDQEKGTLAAGSLTVEALPEGRYRLAVESAGHARSQEVIVTVRSAESTAQSVTLTAIDTKYEVGGTVSEDGVNVWKPIFYVSVVGAVAAGSISGWAYWKANKLGDEAGPELTNDQRAAAVQNGGEKYCDNKSYTDVAKFKEACDKNKLHNITLGVASGFAVLAVVSGVVWYLRGDSDERPSQQAMGKKRRAQYSITPVVSPHGGGATFQLDW